MATTLLCRTCARKAPSTLPLFAVPERHDHYTLALLVATGLQIGLNDGLPQNICPKCSSTVTNILKFRQRCQRAQATFLLSACVETEAEAMEIDAATDNLDSSSSNYGDYNEQINIAVDRDGSKPRHKLDDNKSKSKEWEELVNEFINQKENEIDILEKNLVSKERKCHRPFTIDDNISSDHINGIKDSGNNLVRKGKRKYRRKDTKKNISKHNKSSDPQNETEKSENSLVRKESKLVNEDKIKKSKSAMAPLNHLWKLKPPKSKIVMDKYLDKSAPLYTCILCQKIYKKTGSFVDHTLVHTGFEFMCECCGKVFRSSAKLLRHQRSLHGVARDSRLQCTHCHLRAIDKLRLEEHMRMHTGERPYVCDACGASFTGRELLIQHLTVHITERNVQCEQCPARFRTRKCLNTHRSKRHKPRAWRWACPYCSRVYRALGNCKSHVRSAHGAVGVEERRACIKIPL